MRPNAVTTLLEQAKAERDRLPEQNRDRITSALFAEAEQIAHAVVTSPQRTARKLDRFLDRLLTSKVTGFPVMLAILTVVFWLTIAGANVPGEYLATGLFWFGDQLGAFMSWIGAPLWIKGLLVDGIYLGLAWVVSVMLPPMAIFFPLFTLLEDFGYLPRVAFNLDRLFKRSGAHGKMALSMGMGFGCNAAAVISTRIIDSPRERLIAMITNTFVPCNGRWPLMIMVATIFIAAVYPPTIGSVVAATTLVSVVLLGLLATLLVSAFLSKTWLKGEASAFVLELPPYRKPQVLRVLYTSFIDRTIFVLWRAIIMAAPCGAIAWILGNTYVGDTSLMTSVATFLNPLGHAVGLDGVILLAFLIAIPANEIVIPTMLMAYLHMNKMIEIESADQLKSLLVNEQGWTLLTAVNLMIFSLLHNPCSTTILTIYKESGSKKWTAVAALLPLAIAFAVCFVVAQAARLLGWV